MKIFYTYIFLLCCIPCASKAGETSQPLLPHKPSTPQEWAKYYQTIFPHSFSRSHSPRRVPMYPWNAASVATVHAVKHTPLPTVTEVE